MKALTTIAGDINYQHEQAESKAQEAIGHALEAGRLLADAKAQVKHGQWADWLVSNFKGSARTAQAYMQLANNRDAIEAKTQRVAHLSVRDALKSLSEATTEPAPKQSWLPTDEDTTAIVHGADVVRVPEIVDGALNGYDETYPTLWIQRTPVVELKPEWADTPVYDYVFMDGNRFKYSNYPSPAWCVCYLAMQAMAGRMTRGGRHVRMVSWESSHAQKVGALAGLDWVYWVTGPGFVLSRIDIHKESARRREIGKNWVA